MRSIFIFLSLLLPTFALAKDRTNGSIGLRVSSMSLEGAQGSAGLGVDARFKLTPKWSLEGTADILQGQVIQTALPLSLNAVRYFLPDARVSLYGLGGAGFTFLRNDGSISGEIDHSRVFGNIGFGAEFHVKKAVIAGDLRYLVLDKSDGQRTADSFVFSTTEAGLLSVMVGRAF
jgi:hypothetical protein